MHSHAHVVQYEPQLIVQPKECGYAYQNKCYSL